MLLQQIGSSVGASSVSKVSIPRAVGVVATLFRAFFFMLGYVVSIPRAVGVVATDIKMIYYFLLRRSFNTASGRCCCNGLALQIAKKYPEFQYRER